MTCLLFDLRPWINTCSVIGHETLLVVTEKHMQLFPMCQIYLHNLSIQLSVDILFRCLLHGSGYKLEQSSVDLLWVGGTQKMGSLLNHFQLSAWRSSEQFDLLLSIRHRKNSISGSLLQLDLSRKPGAEESAHMNPYDWADNIGQSQSQSIAFRQSDCCHTQPLSTVFLAIIRFDRHLPKIPNI